jgi:rod shape-determining protein MreD
VFRVPQNIARFVLLILAQVLVFNNIEISGYINPYIYILFILLLPFETPDWLMLVLAFLLGLTVDIFSETMGMHTTATVFMAFIRPFVLSVIAPRDGYESGSYPRIHYFGFSWFLKYTAVLVFLHHWFLFTVEVFRLSEFFSIFFRSLLSAALTLVFIIISQYFVYRY